MVLMLLLNQKENVLPVTLYVTLVVVHKKTNVSPVTLTNIFTKTNVFPHVHMDSMPTTILTPVKFVLIHVVIVLVLPLLVLTVVKEPSSSTLLTTLYVLTHVQMVIMKMLKTNTVPNVTLIVEPVMLVLVPQLENVLHVRMILIVKVVKLVHHILEDVSMTKLSAKMMKLS
jgi:hypothetical protein